MPPVGEAGQLVGSSRRKWQTNRSDPVKVLVIEDTQTGLALVKQCLARINIATVLATDGVSGLEKFRDHKPDMVILDIVLPDMDGFEVARRIRASEKAGEWTPILFLTGLTGEQDLARAIAAGGDDYLIKPISEIVLTAKVRAMQRILQMRQSLVVMARKLDNANRELTRLSAVDGLTGVANRRQLEVMLDREWRRCARARQSMAVLIADVDSFKLYNDYYGHLAGDECLKAVAQALSRQLRRPSDFLARYGGEEFAAVLPNTDTEGVTRLAEAMCQAVRDLSMPHLGTEPSGSVTVSIGVAAALPQPGTSSQAIKALLARADTALYSAKRLGRDQVAVAEADDATKLVGQAD